ncbi:MAG: AbrB/MazE/SpoVT family DNA-binding domain-containing protein [Nitrososphaeria archaeon]
MIKAKWVLKVVQTKPNYYVICLPRAIVRAWDLKKGDKLELQINENGIQLIPLKEVEHHLRQNFGLEPNCPSMEVKA